jgi:hypothetical protein
MKHLGADDASIIIVGALQTKKMAAPKNPARRFFLRGF